MQRRGPARRLAAGGQGGSLSEPDHVSRFLGPISSLMAGPTSAQLGHEPLSPERDQRGAGYDPSVLGGRRSVGEPWARGTQLQSRNSARST